MTSAVPLELFPPADEPAAVPVAAPTRRRSVPTIDYADPGTWPTRYTSGQAELVIVVPSRTGHMRQYLTPGGTDPYGPLAPMLAPDAVAWCRLPTPDT